jgi:LysM repeat protein
MPEPYQMLIEIAAFAPVKLNVTDTCPTCPGGWRDRPGHDHHTAKKAVDFAVPRTAAGQRKMRDFARWWLQHSDYLVGAATSAAHVNHVHVAAEGVRATALLATLRAAGPAKGSVAKVTRTANKKAPAKRTAAKKAGLASSYTVKAGDTLGAIAGRFGVTVDGIRRLNPAITDPNVIQVGQVIRML